MKRIILGMLGLSLGISLNINGMDKQSYDDLLEKKECIENSKLRSHLEVWGDQDADSEDQLMLARVKQYYIDKGLLQKENLILLKYLSPKALELLKKNGCASWNNAITNGRNIVHVDRRIKELSADEQESLVGHELAHIALNKNEKLNKMAEIFYSEDGTSLLDFYNIIKRTPLA